MRKVIVFAFCFLCLLPLFSPKSYDVYAITEDDVTKQLKCTCGCGFPDLYSCSCEEWALPAKAEIRKRIAEGQDLKTILKFFVDREGEIVLTTPVQEGFNHATWIVPGVSLFAALILIGFIIRKWSTPNTDPQETLEPEIVKIEPNDQKYLDDLSKEISEENS